MRELLKLGRISVLISLNTKFSFLMFLDWRSLVQGLNRANQKNFHSYSSSNSPEICCITMEMIIVVQG